jgi:hypothetical protein
MELEFFSFIEFFRSENFSFMELGEQVFASDNG